MKARKWIFRIAALAIVVVIAAVMFKIGRGHTVYFDNKEITGPDGTVYAAPYEAEVFVDGTSVGKLKSGERGMSSIMGQEFDMKLVIRMKKDGKRAEGSVTVQVPYDLDGIILNIPAMLGGAAEDVYMEEFIPAVVEEETEDVVVDEFAMPTDE